jgi:hypothetical protein
MAAEDYRSAKLVFCWSFYSRGSVRALLRPQMNFLTRLWLSLAIQIPVPERRGRRAKDWRSSSLIVEPYWFWMGWSRSKIRLVRKRAGCVSLLSRRFCASWLLSILGFA